MVAFDNDNVIVPWLKSCFVSSEILAAQPLDPVSIVCLSDFTANRDAQPGARFPVGSVPFLKENQAPGLEALAVSTGENKIPAPKQAIIFCKALVSHQARIWLC